MNKQEQPGWVEPLNEREVEIVALISDGDSNPEIARKLSLSLETIKWYNKSIYRKLGVGSRSQAAAMARRYGFLDSQAEAPLGSEHARNNLPAQLTSFVGRVAEIAEVTQLLKSNRLVVLTGPGGTGKTRLAIQVASQLLGYYQDGTFLVELAPLSNPDLVPHEIAQTLGLSERSTQSPIEYLKHYLARKHLLLLLDNFEHLQAAAPVVVDLLSAANRLTIFVTSRERLHVYGVQEYSLQPLALPEVQSDTSLEALQANDAYNLFVQRAQSIDPSVTFDAEQALSIAQICVRLDGLPLALELAASRIKLFSPAMLVQHLEERLVELSAGTYDRPQRQRTLYDTISWSYGLLSEAEQVLFCRLSVFSAGATMQAIKRVCVPEMHEDLITNLASLVDKSLVMTRSEPHGEKRFGMLETIRAFAWQRMKATGENLVLQRNHAAYFADLAEQAEAEFPTSRQVYWFAKMRSEQDNLRAALGWSLEEAEPEYGLRIVAALMYQWFYGSSHAEGWRWIKQALDYLDQAAPKLQAGVLRTAGRMAFIHGDLENAKSLQTQALEIYQQLEDQQNAAWSLVYASHYYFYYRDEYQQGIDLCQKGLEILQKVGDMPGIAQALNALGEFYRMLGDDETALRYYEQCMQVVEQTGEVYRMIMLTINMSFIAHHKGDHQLAIQLLRRAIENLQVLDKEYGMVTCLFTMAGYIAASGNPERGARLIGAADHLLVTTGEIIQPSDANEIEDHKRDIHLRLGDAAYRAAWEAGRGMTLQEAVAFALED